jgi:hypothetical protein
MEGPPGGYLHDNNIWIESKQMYYQRILRLMKTPLHQSRYAQAALIAEEARYEWFIMSLIDIEYTISPGLSAKFYLG